MRERIDDIPVLTQNLLEGINRSMHSSYHLMPDVYDSLKDYQYPGNVRELRNILFIAATHSHNREIDAAIISNVIANMPHCKNSETEVVSHAVSEMPLTEGADAEVKEISTLKSMEEKHIRELLERYQGNRKHIAEALGISERTIYRKLKRLGLN